MTQQARPILKITYWDHSEFSGDFKLEEIEKARPLKCVVIGELLKEDDLSIVVLSRYFEEYDNSLKPDYYAMLVLKGCIIEKIELEEKKRGGSII